MMMSIIRGNSINIAEGYIRAMAHMAFNEN